MKKILFILLLLPILTVGQNSSINYKAIVKDDTGAVIRNTNITVQFSVLRGVLQEILYTETHSPSTDDNGLIILNIGTGTPVFQTYDRVPWDEEAHYLNVQIDTGSGMIDMGTTQFRAVPFAINSTTADNVNGLEALDEGNGIGWRLIGKDENSYGEIGEYASDFSHNSSPSTTRGATGRSSFAAGLATTASGNNSTAVGFANVASGASSFVSGGANIASGDGAAVFGSSSDAVGLASFASGVNVHADAYLSTAFGRANVGGGDPTTWVALDPLFEVGIGSTGGGNDRNALTIYKNGNVSFGNNFVTAATPGFSFGSSNRSSGERSFTAGINNTANGDNSFALGTANSATGDASFALGLLSSAEASYSFALGSAVRAFSENEIVIGSMNTLYTPTGTSSDRLFVIGNGDAGIRRNAMTVLKNGRVGIGTSTPEERLHIANGRLRIGTETIEDTGSNQLSFNAGLFPDNDGAFNLGNSSNRWNAVWAQDGTINTSDRREKENIKKLSYGLNEILQLNPVRYQWKNHPEQGEKLGLIAQDLLKVIPEVVKTHEFVSIDEEGTLQKKELDRLGVYYSDLIPVLVKALQEQQLLINDQNLKIQELETKASAVDTIEIRMNQLEALLKDKI